MRGKVVTVVGRLREEICWLRGEMGGRSACDLLGGCLVAERGKMRIVVGRLREEQLVRVAAGMVERDDLIIFM